MIVTAIAAISRTGVIGDGTTMPWHLPRDLRRFRDATMGKPMIMGRRTQETLRGPLPGRLNIVLSRSATVGVEGFRIARSVDEAIRIAEADAGTGGEVMIIGGGVVYRETVPLWDRVWLTVVEGEFPGTTHFPLDRACEARWRLVGREDVPADPKNAFPHSFLKLERDRDDDGGGPAFDLSAWLADSPPR